MTGRALSPLLPGIAGLTVQLVDKNVGGDVVLATTQTRPDGSYVLSPAISRAYLARHSKTQPDLQVQVSAGNSQLASSAVRYFAPTRLSLDVVLPASATGLPSEYETLAANLAAVYPGNLGELQENAARQDITYLANKTGWDARAVALAALAGQFSQVTAPVPPPGGGPDATQAWPVPTTSIAPEFYYALFRAGLPADADSLFRTPPRTVQAIWQQAAAQGVIPPALAAQVPAAVRSYQALSAAHVLTGPPMVGVSTLEAMVGTTLTEAGQPQQFAQLYAQYAGDWARFWPAVEQQFGAEQAGKLQLQGQLYYLTINNEPLVAALSRAEADSLITATGDLAGLGYYDPARWAPLIGASIPPEIPGADATEQAANYAQYLAAQVRLAFPTAVVADQVQRGILPVADTAEVSDQVVSFLSGHQADFQIGAEPVQAYLARTGAAAPSAEVITQVKRIQRAYQLTPDDASMAVLLQHNLDSAFAVMRYDAAAFSRAFAVQLGGSDTAAQIYSRARQIHFATLSLATWYLGGRTAPVLGGQAPVQSGSTGPVAAADPGAPVTAYPTLENLFGSLDYCDCTDCGSILSPAAYLVDLLNYLDQPAPSAGGMNPQDVLLGRRPDLQYLALTCENTNTAMPYIDLVNETLEYYVANGLSLAGYQGHDTGDTVTSAELIASPQYVNDAAYDLLGGVLFPAPLPFSRPLALLRLHLARLGVTLPDAMAALRSDSATPTPTSYGWDDILIEQLAISQGEYKIFTDPAQDLGALYGLLPLPPPAAAPAPLAVLQATSLQDFSRRLGVSYDDLVSIVQTQFINPNAALIPRLEQLGASFATLQQLKATAGGPQSTAAAFIAALPAGLDATAYGGVTPDDYQAVVGWVTSPDVYNQIMGIITITDPSGDGGDCSGADLQFRYSDPDPATNLLSGTDFLRLIRFIRLWQKLAPLLGDPDDAVTIERTDDILTALYPAADLPADSGDAGQDAQNRPLLDAGFTVLLHRAGFVFRLMQQLALTADEALDQLLACFAPIVTVGPNALYSGMFLTPTLLEQDPGAQTATVSSLVTAGDQLTTVINQVPVGPYVVTAGQTPLQVAQAVAAGINAAPGLAGQFFASAPGPDPVITIVAGFTLTAQAVAASGPASETYTAAASSPIAQTATVAGPVRAGDVLTTVINDIPIPYQIPAGQSAGQVAASVAAAVNATTVADPGSGLPLSDLVVASSVGAVVSVIAASPGSPFSLACSLQVGGAGTYAVTSAAPAAATATITGTVAVGDQFTTTINGIPLPYTATANDTIAGQLAASIAAAVNGAAQPDATGIPLSSDVRATAAGEVVTVTAADPSQPFTLQCSTTSATAGYAAAAPTPQRAAAAVAGTIPAGTILTTTIDTVPLAYQAIAGDTPDSVATAIASLITSSPAVDPNANLPIPQVVTATAAGAVVTVTARSVTTPFTLTVAMSSAGYTAGRAAPPFAPDSYGRVLQDPAQLLFSHEPTLCAACNLTGAEFGLITQALGYDPSTTLSLDTVSALFRYGWLAHTLGVSVLELLLLGEFTGLIPLAGPGQWPEYPFGLPGPGSGSGEPPMVKLIGLLNALAAAGADSSQALYVLWNQDLSGTSAPAASVITGLALTLRADYAAVEAQFTIQSDPDGSIAQGLMTLVYGSAATGYFFGLLNNTVTASVPYPGPPGLAALAPQTVAPSSGRLSYDSAGKQLTFAGLLDPGTLGAITAAVTVNTSDSTDHAAAGAGVSFTPASMTNIYPGSPLAIDAGAARETVAVLATSAATFTASTGQAHDGTGTAFPIVTDPALTAALAGLAAATQQAVGPFFAQYPELLPLYQSFVASADPVQDRRTALLASFLPALKVKRKQEQALAAISSAAGSDPSFASALLPAASVLHAEADPALPAISDLTAIENPGLSAQFFLGNDPLSPPDQVADSVPALSYFPTVTVGGNVRPGDTLTITVNGTAVAYQVQQADTSLPVLAGSLAAAVNAAAGVNQLVSASVPPGPAAGPPGSVIVIAGLDPSGTTDVVTLQAQVSAGAGETLTVGTQLPGSGSALAGTWAGFITAPQDGAYDISIATDPGAGLTVVIAGVTITGELQGTTWGNTGAISLTAGQLVPITITATSVRTTFAVYWTSPGLGWQPLPGTYLYAQSLVSRLGDTYVRFLKATSLAAALSLTAPELSYLGTASSYAVSTASGSTTGPGPAQLTPQSMTNIGVGSVLIIDDGSAWETVTVTAVTATAFTAVTARPHDGATTPFPVVSQAQPAIGQGWLSFLAGQGWLPSAPPPDPDLATAASLAAVLTALLDFARMKKALSSADGRLLAVLQNPSATLPYDPAMPQPAAAALPPVQSALLSLTGWSLASANALLTQFFSSTDPAHLSSIENFRRVYDAYAIVSKCRVSASTLISAITNAPAVTAVSTLQSALRALYAEPDWLTVVGPINDAARIMQRDALVAYIVQREGDGYAQSATSQPTTAAASLGATSLAIADAAGVQPGMLVQSPSAAPGTTVSSVVGNAVTISAGLLASLAAGARILFAPSGITFSTPDSLYEYFLIDPLTQPPVQTSRIRLALSAVQLFTERVVRNLEPQVSPADVDTSLWAWMKRYRLWQANREVFLWPENWLDEELRDDQSPIFKQMMSTLLQGDITDDAAATAYLTYLTSLEELAKLEPCGMWYVPATADTSETCYVIARTAGARRKLYFRQYAFMSWTPWAEVPIECEDMPITPIVWDDRLFLFWLKVLKQSPSPEQNQSQDSGPLQAASTTDGKLADLPVQSVDTFAASASSPPQIPVQAILSWTEFYNGQWQPTKTSDVNHPTSLGNYDTTGPGSFESMRNLVRIVPAQFTGQNEGLISKLEGYHFAVPADALMLAIQTPSFPPHVGGFLLHNTHSLPVPLDDVNLASSLAVVHGGQAAASAGYPLVPLLDLPNPSRSFLPGQSVYTGSNSSGTFSIGYVGTPNGSPSPTIQILSYDWAPRVVEPQPWLPGDWTAPFIYEDRRNLFYVLTTEHPIRIGAYPGYGLMPGVQAQGTPPAISPPVLRNPVIAPSPAEIQAVSSSGSGPAGIQRLLAQGADIKVGLASQPTVSYQGQVISPTGSTAALAPAANDTADNARGE